MNDRTVDKINNAIEIGFIVTFGLTLATCVCLWMAYAYYGLR